MHIIYILYGFLQTILQHLYMEKTRMLNFDILSEYYTESILMIFNGSNVYVDITTLTIKPILILIVLNLNDYFKPIILGVLK